MALAAAILAMAVSAYAIWTGSFDNASNDFNTDTLDPPTSLAASVFGSSIKLDWAATVDTYADNYKVLRSTSAGGSYSQIDTVTPVTTATYTDSTAAAGTRYYYVLQTSEATNWLSLNSNEANSAVPAVVTNPATCNSSNSWTSPANAQGAPDNIYATAAPAKNGTVNGDWACFGFDSAIPAGSVITKVEILAEYKVSTATSIATLRVNTLVGGAVQGGTIEDTSEPLSDFDYVSDHTSLRSWTRTDLLDANFSTRVGARRGNSNTAVTFSLDSVRVRVTYEPP